MNKDKSPFLKYNSPTKFGRKKNQSAYGFEFKDNKHKHKHKHKRRKLI